MKNWGMLAVAATAITFGSTLAMPDVAEAAEGQLGVACGSYAANRQITRGEILARSRTWLTARVPYSQTDCFGNKHGAYRTDCSGFVSMAWGLRVSYTTHILEQVAHRIDWADLRPGDALNDRLNHVALFIGWADTAKTRPIVREQAGPNGSKPVQRVWSAATARTYTPLRYNNLVEGTAIPDSAPVTVDAAVVPAALAGPQVSNTVNGSLDVYARAEDGTLVRNFHKTSRWNGWQALGTERFAGDPTALVNPETKVVDLYVRGTDGKIYLRSGDNAWAALGDTTLAGDPVVAWNATSKANEVFARSYEGKLMRFSGTAWTEVGARGVVGNPSVVWNTETKTLEVYARSADDKLLRAVDKDWEQVGDGSITSDPSAVMAGKNVEIYARDADGAVAQIVAGAYKKIGGKIKGAPSAVWNSGANAVDLVAWGESGLVEYQRVGAEAWTKLGTQLTSKAPTAIYHAQTKTLEVFARDNGGQQTRRFLKEKTGWSPWSQLGDQPLAR
ncbi:hypothetical protein FKR81_36675 [Lentzea tibetensis]|uniref:PLL-like beta propeller domain-containing protein n=1 Tax=Lentzea tibetensis TaxID=2591470 RepID=A0A563EHW8_9PSEU|nr:hypothetical protein [Lentzea tibetensis]TWP46273.1 hypothetical protein FKR81_36675 [Lentzea tibetensis]